MYSLASQITSLLRLAVSQLRQHSQGPDIKSIKKKTMSKNRKKCKIENILDGFIIYFTI